MSIYLTTLIYILSLTWVGMGTYLIIYTKSSRKSLEKIFFTGHTKILSALPFIFGIILIIGAFYHKEIFWILFILGLLGLLKGLYFFFGPPDQVKNLLDWWFHKAGEETIRLFGLILFIIGCILLSYLIKFPLT